MSKSKDREKLQQQGYAERYSLGIQASQVRATAAHFQGREQQMMRALRVSLERETELHRALHTATERANELQRALQAEREQKHAAVDRRQHLSLPAAGVDPVDGSSDCSG